MRAAVVRDALGSLCASLLVAHGTAALAAGPVPAPAPDPVVVAQAASSPSPGVARVAPEMRDLFAAGLAARRAGDPAKAAREFADPAWAATPVHDYAQIFLAQSLLATGDAAGARAAAARAVEAAPDGRPTAWMLSQAAAILSSAGDDGAAAALCRRFLERYPDHPDAARIRFALARALLAARRVPEAARVLNELWVVAPASSYADEAARQLRILGEGGFGGLVPTDKERVERAERLLGAGREDTARSEAQAVLDGKPPAELASRALRVVADSARRAGRLDAAIQVANRALAELPADRRAPWWLELARLQHKKSRDSALPTIDRIVRDYPQSAEAAEALELRARIFEASGRSGDAEAVYQKLAADHPDHDEGGAAAWRLGWISWLRGAYGDAAARWERMAKARSGRAHREAAVYWIGRAHQQRGETEAATRQFALVQADGVRSYYGILATRRSGAAPPAAPSDLALPAAALEPIEGDVRFARVEVLRGAGLGDLADEELDELARRSIGEPKRLYAVAAVYAQDARHHLALRILRRHFQPYARSGLSSLPRPFWEMFYPLGWRAEITDAAGRAAIDPLLVAAVVREESSYYPQARSRVGARGLMQLMPDTARPLAQARKLPFNNGNVLDDPSANLDMGSGYLAGLLREFGDARLAVAAYNAGPTRVREWWTARRSDDLEVWVEQIPFNETRAFVKRVMLSWEEYRRLYGAATSAEPTSPPVSPTKP